MSCMTAGDAAAAQEQACAGMAAGDPHPGRPLVLITDTAMQGVLSAGAIAAADICQGLESLQQGAALRRHIAAEHHALQQAKEAEHQAFLRAHAARQSNPYFRDVPVFEPCKVGVAGLDDAHVPDWQDGG